MLIRSKQSREQSSNSDRSGIKHGITPLAGRNTALATLAADLPAVVLADLLGIHPQTAVRWVRIAKRNWHTYLAHRRADLAP